MKAYREWLPADGYEGTGSLGGSYYSDDISDYYLTPHDLGYWPFVKFDHDFVGREALESIADQPRWKKVTLAWNGEDVAGAIGTMFEKGPAVKYIDFPLSNYATWPYDKVFHDGDMVGVSTFSGYSYNERTISRWPCGRGRRARHRGDACLGRGRRRLIEAGRRAPRAGRVPGDREPSAVLRGGAHVLPRGLALDSGCLAEGRPPAYPPFRSLVAVRAEDRVREDEQADDQRIEGEASHGRDIGDDFGAV